MAKNKNRKINNVVNNGLASALDIPQGGYIENALTSPKSLFYNSSPYFITLNWTQLAYAYKSNGFIQTAINQIVDDAFRNDGLIIDTKTLDTNELEQLKQAIEDNGDIEAIKDCIKWGQLYGGGVLIANTEQNPKLPLLEKNLQGKKLTFYASDRWQCIANGISPEEAETFILTNALNKDAQAGITIDKSRIGIFTGVKAPYFLKAMLQGWGMSIFESIIPPLTQYLKSMGVTLELLDEAKIDIFKISDMASLLMTADGERAVKKRLQLATDNKNYKSSIAMDTNDDYQQKQIHFSGLPEMIEKIQYLLCAALRRPYSKLFGKGGSGLSEETSDLENYNSIVDSEIRTPAKALIKWVVNLRCCQLFGRPLPDFRPRWKALKVLDEKEENEIKSKKLADYLRLLDHQVMTKQQVAKKLTEDGIVLFSNEEISNLSDDLDTENINNEEELLNAK